MPFFDAALKRGGRELVFSMNPLLRGMIVFALVSVASMLLFNFEPGDFAEAPLLGKLNLIILPLLLLLGSLYKYTIRFDAETKRIRRERGLLFLSFSESWSFSELTSVECTGYATRKIDIFSERRYSFGFSIAGRTLMLEKALSHTKAKQFLALFRSFFPGADELLGKTGNP
jgi:hypothetical protein